MKSIILRKLFLFFSIAVSLSAFSQVPEKINYQAVARDANGTIIASKSISVRFSIHDNGASGPVVYSETQKVVTNALGVFSVAIGGGTIVSGSMSTINWGLNDKFLQVEFDPNGGNSYSDMGSTQLLSVPFALYSANGKPGPEGPAGPAGATGPAGPAGPKGDPGNDGKDGINGLNGKDGKDGIDGKDGKDGASSLKGGTTNTLIKFQDDSTGVNSMITDNGQTVGINQGTMDPNAKLDINGRIKIRGGSPGKGKVLTSDSLGLASWQDGAGGSKVGFSAKFSSGFNIPSGGAYYMNYGTEDFDHGNNFADTAFTAPADGVYHFDVLATWYQFSTATGYNYINLRVNGATYTINYQPNLSTLVVTNEVSANIELKKGDTVTCTIYQNSGATQVLNFTSSNRFSGYRVY
ncbi:MAG: hypothetical protein H6605_02845 [Flavobacteriales bacterium]|nr:hypothetical protein [Flavobacteriales bacterium]